MMNNRFEVRHQAIRTVSDVAIHEWNAVSFCMATVLIVDDDDVLRTVLKAFLRSAGFEVVSAASGPEALAIVAAQPLSLMVSDIRMRPMNGLELLRRVRESHPLLPVVMLTAYSSRDTAREAEVLGAYAYLAKPFTNDELIQTVKDAIEGRPRHDETARS
jgi:DNA-binding NtrC family response regulator